MNGYTLTGSLGRTARRVAFPATASLALAALALTGFRGEPAARSALHDAALQALHVWPSAAVRFVGGAGAAPVDALAVRPVVARSRAAGAAGAAPAASLSPAISATKTDAGGPAGAGDVISYTVEISNTGTSDALGVTFTDTVDPNTTLTGAVRVSPIGFDDAYDALVGYTTAIPAPGLLTNDYLGSPAAAVTAFSFDNFTTSHAAGSTAPVAPDGSLTVNADGSFTFEPPTGFAGSLAFQYRLANTAGFDAATVTLTAATPSAPTAVDDAPDANSAPGDAFHTALDTELDSDTHATPGVLDNDDLGLPVGALASFGGGSLGGAVTDHAPGSTVTFGTSGSLTLHASGRIVFQPDAGFTGLFTFEYRLTNPEGSDDATVTIAVGVRPAAVDDDYAGAHGAIVGNTRINTAGGTGFSVLANDAGDGATAVLVSATNGTATVNASGTFAFEPNAGYTGPASITYKVTNGFGDSPTTATVSLTVAGLVWFVDNSLGVNGDGRLWSPFNVLSALSGAGGAGDPDAAGQAIFLYTGSGDYTGGIELESSQLLIGQGAGATLSAITGFTLGADAVEAFPATGGTAPVVAGGAYGVLLPSSGASAVTLRGFDVGNTTGPGISGSGFGTLTASEVAVGGSGRVLALTSGSVAASFSSLSTTSATGDGISLTSVSGSFAVTGATSVSGTTGTGVLLTTNSAAITFAGLDVAPAAGERAVHATGNTGTIASASGAISASGAVAVEVAGASSFSPSPLNVTLTSVSASGGTNGIVLTNTSASGSPGGFRVVGDGTTAGSGGSISGSTGADGLVAGNGVYLNNTRNVSLSFVNLSNSDNNGLLGTGVRDGLALDGLAFTGTHGTSSSPVLEESAVHLVDAGGTVTVSNSQLDGGAWSGFLLRNTSGTAPVLDLVVEDNSVGFLQGNLADLRDGAVSVFIGDGTADVRIRDNALTYWWTNAVHVSVLGTTASATARITGNTVHQSSGALAGARGIFVNGGALTFLIANNSVRGANGTAIAADKNAMSNTHLNGTIENNAIGVSGVTNSGSATGIAIFVSHTGQNATTTRIANNVIRQIAGSANGAITVQAGDDLTGGGSGTLNATIVGNDISETGSPTNSAQHGILVTHGRVTGDTDLGCYDIGGAGALANTITNFNTTSATAQNRIRVNQRFNTTSRFPGYTGAQLGATSATDLRTYLLGRNNATNSLNANSSTGGFLDTVPAGSPCPQPTVLPLASAPPAAPANPRVAGPEELLGVAGGPPVAPAAEAAGFGADEPVLLASADPLEAARIAVEALRARQEVEAGEAPATPTTASALVDPDVSVAIGTLPAGKTVTILFDVTVNTPATVTEVSNQGTVSGDNFADVLTDDPDAGGAADPTTTEIIIDEVGPVVSNVVATPNPAPVNTAIALTADASDDTTGGSNIASAAYSLNGGAYQPMAAADGNFDEVMEAVTASIGPFAQAGVHDVCVRATDAVGNTGDPSCILLAVYDPAAGFVTGAGRIDSPAGAYVPNPSLTGPAHFGFISKYQHGANVPTGHTTFRFRAADLDFNSTSFEWLVIAGARAQFKGVGTINGAGNYGFMLTAIDGAVNGGGGMDRFRIKIWDKNNGDAIVYDNQVGGGACADQSDTSTPCTALAAGNIIIQRNGGNGNGNLVALPTEFSLAPPVPNPSSGTATLQFGLPEAARVELVVFDALGRVVARLADGDREPGWYAVALDGARLPSGTYFARLTAGEFRQTQRITLAR